MRDATRLADRNDDLITDSLHVIVDRNANILRLYRDRWMYHACVSY